MNKKIKISISEFKNMCKRAGYVIPKKDARDNLMAYHFRVSDLNEFELTGTDGWRIVYQTKQFDSLAGSHWVCSVLKERLDTVMSYIRSEEIEIEYNAMVSLMTIKELDGEKNIATFPTLESNFWKHDTSHIVARGRKVLTSGKIMSKKFRELVKAELARPPLTYKDLDNDNIMFVYAGPDAGVAMRKGSGMAVYGAELATIDRKFISDLAKNVDPSGELTFKIIQLKENMPMMLIVEDRYGGHGIMPVAPKMRHFLGDIRMGEYFRIPGYAATFCRRQGYEVLYDGDHPEALSEYRHKTAGSPVYSFREHTEVFLESFEEMKLRERRRRKKQ